MAPDYSKGKIYKLVNDVDDEIYVGSTCQPLWARFSSHKRNSKTQNTKCYKHWNSIGWDNCHIILVEEYPCGNKEQLTARERYWIEEIGTLNKIVPGRTGEEYYKLNKDAINARKKEYYIANKEAIKEQRKQYYDANRDAYQEQKKQYREENKEAIKEQQKQWYEANKDKFKEQRKQYYEANKEAINARRREARARKKVQA